MKSVYYISTYNTYLYLCTTVECGISRYEDAGANQNAAYIVNGWEARIHEFPWQVG